MRSSAQAQGTNVRVRDLAGSKSKLMVLMPDGRTINAPLAWYSRPAAGTPKHWAYQELAGAGYGIHWPGRGRCRDRHRGGRRCWAVVQYDTFGSL